MSKGQYQPYKTGYSLKSPEPKNKKNWFTYDPYEEDKVGGNQYPEYKVDVNPSLKTGVPKSVQKDLASTTQKSIGRIVFGYLLKVIFPIFSKIKLGISSAVNSYIFKGKSKSE